MAADDSQLRHLEEVSSELRSRADDYVAVFNAIPQPCWIFDRETLRFLAVNDAAIRSYGYTREEFLQMTILDMRPASEHPRVLEDVARTRRPFADPGPWLHMRKDGSTFLVEISVDHIPFQGRRARVSIVTDITERLRMQAALRDSEERLRSSIELASDAIFVADLNGRYTSINERGCLLVGYSQEELLAMSVTDLLPESALPRLRALLAELLAGKTNIGEWELRRKDGSWVPVEISTKILPGGRWQAFVRDITRRKAIQQELARKTAALERSNAELQEFAYVTSHDLQEPLRMMSSYAQLLARRYKGQLDQDATEFIEFIVSGSLRLKGLIDALLIYSRVVNIDSSPRLPVDMNESLAEAERNIQARVAESGAIITHSALPSVNANPVSMVQLLQNLLSNALKYRSAEAPQVHVSAELSGNEWLFSVRDNGIGIPTDQRQRIFGVFKRLHGTEVPGAGIGLAICHKIVERHGGRIWVEANEGGGSTFHFTLPAH